MILERSIYVGNSEPVGMRRFGKQQVDVPDGYNNDFYNG